MRVVPQSLFRIANLHTERRIPDFNQVSVLYLCPGHADVIETSAVRTSEISELQFVVTIEGDDAVKFTHDTLPDLDVAFRISADEAGKDGFDPWCIQGTGFVEQLGVIGIRLTVLAEGNQKNRFWHLS